MPRTSRCATGVCASKAKAAGCARIAQYGDFTLRLGFRYLTEDPGGGRIGVSGVFLRTPATATYQSGWPDNSLEVQLANRQGGRPAIPGDARWGGAVLRHGNPGGPTSFDTRLALRSYGRTGEWQTLEIQAIGDAIHVTLNDNYLGTALGRRQCARLYRPAGGDGWHRIPQRRDQRGRQGIGGGPQFRRVCAALRRKDVEWLETAEPEFARFRCRGWRLVVRGRPPGTPAGAAPTAPTCSGNIWTENLRRFRPALSGTLPDERFGRRLFPAQPSARNSTRRHAGRMESGRDARDGGQAAAVERHPDAERRR